MSGVSHDSAPLDNDDTVEPSSRELIADALVREEQPREKSKSRRRAPGGAVKARSRWTRDKDKLKSLEEEAAAQIRAAARIEKENKKLRLRSIAIEHALAARDKQLQILSDYNRLCVTASAESFTREAQDLRDAATASIPVLAAKVQAFVVEASLVLIKLPEVPSRADAEVRHIVWQISAMVVDLLCRTLCSAFVLNPILQFQILMQRLDEPDAKESSPRPGHWDRVVSQMHLSQQQLEELAACWELKNNRVRTKLQPEMAALCYDLSEAVSNNRALPMFELHKRLQSVEIKDFMSYRAFCYMFFARILKPIQLARVLVLSFPYFPNSHELATRLLQTHAL